MNSQILIIGGGVIGLTLARRLHQKGVGRITLLESGRTGGEASSAAAGMLAPQAETDRIDPFFRFCLESRRLYPEFARELLAETGIDIELDQHGTLYLAFDESDTAEIRERYERQRRAGLRVEHLTAREIGRAEPFVSPDVREGLFFPNDWQVENRRLIAALTRYAELNGIRIIENTRIRRLLIENDRAAGAVAGEEIYRADRVILATGAWTSLIKRDAHVPFVPGIRPVRGQMIRFHTAKRLFRRVIYSPRGYIVPRRLGTILAGATVEEAGFDRSVTKNGTDLVYGNALEIVPSLASLPIDDRWAGLRPVAPDRLPVIGEIPQIADLFVATGHYRNGILLAPATAEILAERIAENRVSRYLDIFGPQRLQPEEKTAVTGF